jgi:hypothetical protein
MKHSSLTTVRGIVIPTGWNAGGGVVSVAIATYFEEKIPVQESPSGTVLLNLLQKRVVVEGVLHGQGPGASIEVVAVRIDDSPISGERAVKKGSP